jgi:glutathione S-transferase
MKLYFAPGACSLSPHIVLREAGLPFDLEKVSLSKKQTAGGADFSTVNPKGYVPALHLDDGEILTEGPAIVQYLADRKPETHLAPAAGTMARYRLQEWLSFIGTELHKQYSPLFNSKSPDETKTIQREYLARRIAFVAHSLTGKPYLMGDHFTVADAYLFTVLRWSKLVGVDLGAWPVIGEYLERVAARPAVHAALEAEGLLKAS